MNQEQIPRSMEELFAERDRLVDALRFKDEQTAANIAAGVVSEKDSDQDRESLEAELAEINAEIVALRDMDGDQSRLEGI
jgi:hypothetical protein